MRQIILLYRIAVDIAVVDFAFLASHVSPSYRTDRASSGAVAVPMYM